MGRLYVGQDSSGGHGLAESRSGYWCVCMGWRNLGQDRGVTVRAGCI
jgi:hypothetical protein